MWRGSVGRWSGCRGRRSGRPDQCGQAAHGQVVGHRVGVESLLHGESGQQRLDQDGELLGRSARLAPTAVVQPSSWRAL